MMEWLTLATIFVLAVTSVVTQCSIRNLSKRIAALERKQP